MEQRKKNIIFTKFLTQTDILKSLAIPTNSLASLDQHFHGGHAMKLAAKDENGKLWPFVCSIRKTGHRKPVFQRKGWRSFELAKHLKVGDKVIFFEDGIKVFGSIIAANSSPTYGIEVERRTILLQQVGRRSSAAYSYSKFLVPASPRAAGQVSTASTTSNKNRLSYS